MKKVVKIFSIILISLILLCTATATFVYAQPLIPDAGEYRPADETAPGKVTNMIGIIATTIQIIGVVLSVIVIAMLGIKYLVGSAEEKADYKKAMLPFLIGAILIASIGTILRIVSNFTSQTLE